MSFDGGYAAPLEGLAAVSAVEGGAHAGPHDWIWSWWRRCVSSCSAAASEDVESIYRKQMGHEHVHSSPRFSLEADLAESETNSHLSQFG